MSQIPTEILEQQIREVSASASASEQRLCSRCEKMEIWTQPFRIIDKLSDLEQRSPVCDFCLLRWRACKDLGIHTLPRAAFEKSGSHITVNGRYPPVLSLFQEPGMYTLTQSLSSLESVDRDTHKFLKQQPSKV